MKIYSRDLFYKKKGIPPIDNHTTLLLHGENFMDSSYNNYNISNYGIVINDDGKFDKCFYNSSSKYMEINAQLIPQGDFTIDFWCKITSQTSGYRSLFRFNLDDKAEATCATGIYVQNNRMYLLCYNNNTWDFTSTYFVYPFGNDWHHVAIVREGSIIKLYLDGVYKSQKLNIGQLRMSSKSIFFRDFDLGSQYLVSYLDEFRVSNIARWTSDFTPPIQPYS